MKDLFLYLIVGGIATIVEWIFFYLFDSIFAVHYIAATVAAYIISTFANWLSGRMIMFKASKRGIISELLSIYAASVIGLLLNVLIMWLLVDMIGVESMIAKIMATGIVFGWNFAVRKLFIYKETKA